MLPSVELQGEEHCRLSPLRSSESGFLLGVLGTSVGLGVGSLDAGSLAPMSLGLAHGRSSEEKSVGAYI